MLGGCLLPGFSKFKVRKYGAAWLLEKRKAKLFLEVQS